MNKLSQFIRWSWGPFLRLFSLRGNRRNEKKNTFSAVEDFASFWWHSGTQQLIRRAKQKQTGSMPKQHFAGEALSKQNIKAWLASLSSDLLRAPTKWSGIFAFRVYVFQIPLSYISISNSNQEHIFTFYWKKTHHIIKNIIFTSHNSAYLPTKSRHH